MKNQILLSENAIEEVFEKSQKAAKEKCGINPIEDFFKNHPLNTDPIVVAAKIALVDITYSTFIARYKKKIQLCDIVKIIINIEDFDKRVANGDPKLVSEIAGKCQKIGINLFSFASKYCCLHNFYIYQKDDYSIYDSRVEKHLPLYATKSLPVTSRQISKWKNNCDYKSFNDYIGNLLNEFNINIPHKRRAFDLFLWYAK